MVWLVAGVCGALGVTLRLGVNSFFSASEFPIATLIVNALGSLLIGFLYGSQSAAIALLSPAVYTGLSVGLLGALTTFSSFSLESLRLFQSGAVGLAVLNIFISNVVCLSLCFAGYKAALSWVNS